jgi:chromate reductase, NAD(P)H dehydrogenase (quinone)
MNILAISGSLQSHSSNSVLIREAAAQQSHDVVLHIFERLGELPHFNPDLDGDFPAEPIAALRNVARAADALLIASPEYAHEMPGSLKNALDWLVSSGELYGKPAAVLCGSPSSERGRYAREALQRTLEAQGARVVLSTTVAVQRAADGTATVDTAAARMVRRALQALQSAAAGSCPTSR